MPNNAERCKQSVWHGYCSRDNRCYRKAVRDGYCKQHHPDAVAEREKKSRELYEEKKKRSAWYRLDIANKRIIELEKQVEDLEQKLSKRKESV